MVANIMLLCVIVISINMYIIIPFIENITYPDKYSAKRLSLKLILLISFFGFIVIIFHKKIKKYRTIQAKLYRYQYLYNFLNIIDDEYKNQSNTYLTLKNEYKELNRYFKIKKLKHI